MVCGVTGLSCCECKPNCTNKVEANTAVEHDPFIEYGPGVVCWKFRIKLDKEQECAE